MAWVPLRGAQPFSISEIDKPWARRLINDKLAADSMPINIFALMIFSSLFLLREIEVAALARTHVTLDRDKKTVRVFLAVSKTDPHARGCHRSWGGVSVGMTTKLLAHFMPLQRRATTSPTGSAASG